MNAESKQAEQDDEYPDNWAIAMYQEALTDIRWTKATMGQVARWAVTISIGLLALTRTFDMADAISMIIVTSVAVIALGWLVDLHRFASNTRGTLPRLLPQPSAKFTYPVSRRIDRNHVAHLIAHMVVVVASAAISLIGILGD